MNEDHICGIPWDAGVFDHSSIKKAPEVGEEIPLACYQLHRNYCGALLYFSQFTDPPIVDTAGYEWQIRCNGQPRDPYLAFQHVINPWGLSGFPVYLRLEEGCLIEFSVRNLGVGAVAKQRFDKVGGRLLGRYWYNTAYGGVPNQL